MSNDKSDMPDVIYAELDECLKGTKFGDWSDTKNGIYGQLKEATPYVRRSLVDELARIANMAKLHIHGFGAEEIKAKIDEAIAAIKGKQ